MASESKVFREMFSTLPRQDDGSLHVINVDENFDVFGALLHYVYTDSVFLREDKNLYHLSGAARKYAIKGLWKACFMVENS